MNEEMKIRRRRRIVICILVLLFAIGLAYNEADFIGKKTTSTLQYLEVYSAFLPLLIYIVPFVLIMKQLSDKYEIKGTKLLIAAFSGAFIPAALASQINGSFDDLSYITESGFGKLKDAFPTALDRVSSSLCSHWTYAAVTAAGLYLILRSTGRNHKRRGIGWILFVIADHFLYDTPIGDINLFNAILQAAVVIPLIVFFTSPEMKAEERTLLSAGKKETSYEKSSIN